MEKTVSNDEKVESKLKFIVAWSLRVPRTYFDVINIRCCEEKEWKSYYDDVDPVFNRYLYINPCDSSYKDDPMNIIYD